MFCRRSVKVHGVDRAGELRSSAKDRVGCLAQARGNTDFRRLVRMLTTIDAERAGLNTAVRRPAVCGRCRASGIVFTRGS